MSPLFSAIIPTYNRGDYVAETLRSVFAQRFEDYEVIVVDDGSTDGTLDIVRGFGERVRVLEQHHQGCAAARNFGAREARGEYLAFLDSDDLWFPWTLEAFADAARENGYPTFVAGKLLPFERPDEAARVEETPAEFVAGPDFLSTALRENFAKGVAHGVVRREAYLDVGGCLEDDVNCTDSDVLLKLGVAPGFAIIKRPATLAYRQHGGATTRNLDKGFAGARMMLENERRGVYPGGPARRRERLAQILRRVRAISLMCLEGGRARLAWRLYADTWAYNARLGRWAYLAAFPLMLVAPPLRRASGRKRPANAADTV